MPISSDSRRQVPTALRLLTAVRARFLLLAAMGLVASSPVLFTAGAAEPPDPDHAAMMAKGIELFRERVRPLLIAHCFKCHGGESIESGFDMTDRAGLLKGGDIGAVVVLNKSSESLLCKLVAHERKPYMPHEAKKLPAEAIEQIAAWIDLGAPYDQPLKGGKAGRAEWTETVIPSAARKFWSFQSLAQVDPPAVQNAGWCRTSLDRFVLAKMEAAGVGPNPPASKRQLIRRLYFDFIGLPPKVEEIAAFENDSSPDAYEKLVDHLLASPHFGERWARRWLDLARFAESHGFEHDSDRPTAYHYRDFVIRAINDDLPYDKFVKWQLAGDEYEPDNPLAMAATGFLAAGVHSTQITKNEAERHRYDEMDDMLATTGTSMLALTIGCARCHDHKYDPIPQRDYYRMLSAFTTTVRSEPEIDLDPAEYQRAKERFDTEHEPFAAALERFESGQLPARLAAWEQALDRNAKPDPWVSLEPTNVKSAGGATFSKLPDGSLLALGNNIDFDTYTVTAESDCSGITSIRLEALADPSMVKAGPGRADNGNFDLTDFRVTAVPKNATTGKAATAVPVRLRNPRATFEQPGLPVQATIDDDPKSGWAIDPQFGRDHAAVFETESPLGWPGGTVLTFTLAFNGNNRHNIGRFSVSISAAPAPVEIRSTGLPSRIAAILGLPADKREPQQASELILWYRTIDPEWQKLNRQSQEHLLTAPKPRTVKMLVASEGLPPIRLFSQGDDFFKETWFLRRGDVNQKVAVASLGVLQVLDTAADHEQRWQSAPPPGSRTSYRRRALAEWITDRQCGAGSLLARVEVNRLWQFHMGRGIVGTPSDFGARGEAPTHPELLEWLATELIAGGWQLKPIHKQIVMSAAYMQSSTPNEADAKVDPDNRTCWRHPTQRLEAEVIRDALLEVSGSLDPAMFGPGTLDSASRRRSIYFTVKRSKLIPMLTIFDAPDALGGIGQRPTTTVAPQALYLMNNPQVRRYAQAFAARIAPSEQTKLEEAIRSGYSMALGREPTSDEAGDSLAFVDRQRQSYQQAGKSDARQMALADFCQTLMCLNEFVYVE
jgi:Protein of unknown function (DUF1549)/Protein of unknown function (DUF1553)/Planctomycete cytochrome C